MRESARFIVAALSVLATIAAVAAEPSDSGAIAWTDDLAKALAAAKESRRPVLADFWAVWCAPCVEMDKKTYADPTVIEPAAAFVPVKVDGDLHPAVLESYHVEQLPVLLLLDERGDELGRLIGFVPASTLAHHFS